jgi:hypothetical protein
MRLGVPFIAPRQLEAIGDPIGRQFLPSVGWRTVQSSAKNRNRTEIIENWNRTNRTEGTVMKFGFGFLRTEINEIFSVLHSKEPKNRKYHIQFVTCVCNFGCWFIDLCWTSNHPCIFYEILGIVNLWLFVGRCCWNFSQMLSLFRILEWLLQFG